MSEQTAVLESSATVPPPVFEASRGPLVNLTPEQRKEYRTTGELPQAESAPAPESVSETQGKQDRPKIEPKPKLSADERIAQLEATIDKIRKGSGKETPKADPAPAKPELKTEQPKADDFETHEAFEEAMLDWKLDQREAKKASEQRVAASEKEINAKVEEARERYENFDEVIQPAANEIYSDKDIPGAVKQMIGDSEMIGDLVFTIAGDLKGFIKMAKETPGKALRYIALTESLIAQELEGKTQEPPEVPAKPKTQAPKPPAEAGGRAATPPDSLRSALEGSGGKLDRNLKAEFLRRDLARLKG